MKQKLLKILQILTIVLGGFFLVLLILAFTSLPFWMRYHLGTNVPVINHPPDYIVMLGAGGMPDGRNMVRLYHTAFVSKKFPDAKVIISLPGDTLDSLSSIMLMKKELIIRGVNKNKILIENTGNNTRNEVLQIKKMIADTTASLLIVTSPEHLYRSVRCFQKVGFSNIGGHAAFEQSLDDELLIGDMQSGEPDAIPEIGDNLNLRYTFWNHLQYEVIVFREYVAITYYRLKGWI